MLAHPSQFQLLDDQGLEVLLLVLPEPFFLGGFWHLFITFYRICFKRQNI